MTEAIKSSYDTQSEGQIPRWIWPFRLYSHVKYKIPEGEWMHRHQLLTAVLLLLPFGPSAFCQIEEVSPAVKGSCEQVKNVELPANDRPSSEERKALANCVSADLYFGFGQPVNPVKARECAYLELMRGDDLMFGDRTVLMMVYANGKGATRNFDVALKLACEIGGAPAEIQYRVQHLERLKQEHWTGESFNVCDDITSGFMEGACAGLHERFNKQKRQAKLNAIVAQWTPEEQRAFQAFQPAANKFFATRADNEVDLSGTGRAAFEIEEQASLEDGLVATLQKFERGELPRFSAAQFNKADAAMNSAYARIQKTLGFTPGTVTADQIGQTQRSWVEYREAWVKFGEKKYPGVSPESWQTWLTQERTKMLEDFLRY